MVRKRVHSFVGIVSAVSPDFYRRRDKTRVLTFLVKGVGHPIADWKSKVAVPPRVGERVRIICTERGPDKWAPGLDLHYSIESYEGMAQLLINDAKNTMTRLRKTIAKLEKTLDVPKDGCQA